MKTFECLLWGLDSMTSRGPFQPLQLCDSVVLSFSPELQQMRPISGQHPSLCCGPHTLLTPQGLPCPLPGLTHSSVTTAQRSHGNASRYLFSSRPFTPKSPIFSVYSMHLQLCWDTQWLPERSSQFFPSFDDVTLLSVFVRPKRSGTAAYQYRHASRNPTDKMLNCLC